MSIARTTSNANVVKEATSQLTLSIDSLERKRVGKELTIGEVKSLDKLTGDTVDAIKSGIYRALGRWIVNSNFSVAKDAMNHEVQDSDKKGNPVIRDIGVQKRHGIIQSHMLKLGNGSYHLRNCSVMAKLLPSGTSKKHSNAFGQGVRTFWHMLNGQGMINDKTNKALFVYKLIEWLDSNPHITGDTVVCQYEMGKRNYDKQKGLNGVKVTEMTYDAWKVKAEKQAVKWDEQALNSVIAQETAEKERAKRKEKKESEAKDAKTKGELYAKALSKLIEMNEVYLKNPNSEKALDGLTQATNEAKGLVKTEKQAVNQ